MTRAAMTPTPHILTLNAGSSSLKAAVYQAGDTETLLAGAEVDRIGHAGSRLRVVDGRGHTRGERAGAGASHAAALQSVLGWLAEDTELPRVDIVAHRVVHGGHATDPQVVTPELLARLRQLTPIAPDHLPQALEAIETIARTHPALPQVACFDTAFHRSMPSVARLYPLPAWLRDAGVERYGFHGLSCESILSTLSRSAPAEAHGKLIIAHLGGGASMTAVHHGQSRETTMGFSPAGGLMMGTRPGDLDPGVLLYALASRGLSTDDLNRVINRESGLLGLSGTTADMQDLLAREAGDTAAAAAIELFCYLARKSLGSLVFTLGGLDTLVFTGGIGEHSAVVRARIVHGLDAFGLLIDGDRNAAGRSVVSTDASRVRIRVMRTDEDVMLARHAIRLVTSRADAGSAAVPGGGPRSPSDSGA